MHFSCWQIPALNMIVPSETSFLCYSFSLHLGTDGKYIGQNTFFQGKTYLLSNSTLSLFSLAVTWNFTSTLKKMKYLALFTTQDIFFMNYYLKIAHILSKRTAMKAHKIKWEFMVICGFSLECESNPLNPKLFIFFLCFSSSDAS